MTNDAEQRQSNGSHGGSSQGGGSRVRAVVTVVILLVVVAVLVITGIIPRLRANRALAAETSRLAAPTVLVVQPKAGAPSQEIVLPGNIEAFVDSPIFARTNGYLKHWYFDIGSHVRQGQLLADIESPEIDHELSQAKADLGTAQANAHLSEITANRFSDLIKQDAVSQQDTDNAVSDLAARNTAVKSAQANVDRLTQLVAFEKVFAPFDGVVTARNTDIGQLIDSGASGGQARALFQMAAVNRLRVFINVPQIYSQASTPGLMADLTFAEFPGRTFPGKLVRTSRAIDPVSRTLNVEVDVDNSNGVLFPGAYTEVHLKLKDGIRSTLIVPVSALLFRREGLRIAVAKSDNTSQLLPITLGRDFGDSVEVVTGLTGQERVITNPPDSIIDGEKLDVQVEQPQQPRTAGKVAGK